MNEQWLDQAEPLVCDLHKAFNRNTEKWWQNGLRRHSEESLRAQEVSAESKYVGFGEPSPVADAYTTGEVSLRFAQDYLWGATDAVLSNSLFSSFALARCSLEATARCYWLIDPDIGIEERLHRYAQYFAQCFAEVRKTFNAAPQELLATQLERLKAIEKENLDWARYHKLTIKTGTTAFAGTCKGLTDLVNDLLGDMPVGGRAAPMVYRWLSGSSHSNPIVLQEFERRVTLPGDERYTLQMRASSGTAWFPIWWAARGLQSGLNRLADVNGWESPDDFLSRAIAKIGHIVDSDLEHTVERIVRPTVYQEYLDWDD